ncbi:MAG: hypothetical protein HZB92_07305 [Euryarchaeota archaeon]|nr:hypothetical protein [Euryarchaeota archaeon]
MQKKLKISDKRLKEINDLLLDPDNVLVQDLLAVVEKHGGVDEINKKAAESGKFDNLVKRLEKQNPAYVKDLEWLTRERDKGSFVSVADYRKAVLGGKKVKFDERFPVTLEVSSLQYFPFLIAEAKQAIEQSELMPGRYIRVRCMKEQEKDGDLLATAAAMDIVGATWCETLDTKGTDGSNVHLGGPATITGYFGGVGQPNDYPLKWADEFLYYYTNYGVRQVLNINPGTVLVGYMLHKLGIKNEVKISVFMGNDNPYAVLWTLMAARLLSAEDGSTPLIGFNFSNSVNNQTIEKCSGVREALGLADNVRFEHHITETYKSIVRQPYDRHGELVDLAKGVCNISAKHEGGEVATEITRAHPSDILDYFVPKEDVLKQGLMGAMQQNYLDKHAAVNVSARMLTEAGLSFVAAWNLHK